jgi:hypothetical protein
MQFQSSKCNRIGQGRKVSYLGRAMNMKHTLTATLKIVIIRALDQELGIVHDKVKENQ